jgi:hypothetical protein
MVAAVLGCAALASALGLFHFGARRIYGYALTSAGIEVRLFARFPVYRISLRSVERVVFWSPSLSDLTAIGTLRLGNRLVGTAVVITRRRGFPRRIIITPDNPRAFAAALRRRVEDVRR